MFTETIQNKNNINDVMKIHNYVSLGFGPRDCTHTVGVNDSFGPIRSYYPLTTPIYGLGNTKYNIDY